MHRARHSGHSPKLRPRVLIALVAAGAGLAFALWLPTRNDNASASENGRDQGQSQGDYRGDHDRREWNDNGHRDRDRDHRRQPSKSPCPSKSPSESPSASASPTREPSDAPPTTAPTGTAPDVAKWAPFTDYTAGQLVRFDGVEYEVRDTHTSLPGWEPSALPALFKKVN